MPDLSDSVWQAVLGRLQLEMPKEHFDNFLRPCVGHDWDDDGGLIVHAASSFAVSWLELPLHLRMAQQALTETLGREARVIYRVTEATATRPTAPADLFAENRRRLAKAIPDPWGAWCRIRTWEAMEQVVDPLTQIGIARAWAHRTIREWERSGGFLLLAGAPGVGKTYLGCAAANVFRSMGMSTLYGSAPHLADDFQRLLSGGQQDRLAIVEQAYRDADVLLLDDFGQGGAPWGNKRVNQILRSRYQEFLTTIITTNLTMAEIQAIDDALASRLLSGTVVPLIGRDLRQRDKEQRDG